MSHRATRRRAATLAVADALDALADDGPVEPVREAFERLMRIDHDPDMRGTYQRDLEAATVRPWYAGGLTRGELRTLAGDYRTLAGEAQS